MIKLTTFEGLVVFEDHSISSADVLITSDMHLNHANILKYCPPRAEAYQSVDDMTDNMIWLHNQFAQDSALVINLGDVVFGDAVTKNRLVGQLQGNIIHIAGNHDRNALPLNTYKNGLILECDQGIFELGHYPVRKTEFFKLHGHRHSFDESGCTETTFDCGVDAANYYFVDFTPFILAEVIELIENKKMKGV